MTDSTETQITSALRFGPLRFGELVAETGLNEIQVRSWLNTLIDERKVVRELDGRYGLGYGGYAPDPGPGSAA